jgi:hypothetical protein
MTDPRQLEPFVISLLPDQSMQARLRPHVEAFHDAFDDGDEDAAIEVLRQVLVVGARFAVGEILGQLTEHLREQDVHLHATVAFDDDAPRDDVPTGEV